MRIPDVVRRCVVHLYCDERGRPERKRPVGTAFGLAIELDQKPGTWIQVLVTARHVVNGARALGGSLYVRFNTHDGGVIDVPEPPENWLVHPTTDVAVTGVTVGPRDVDFTSFPAVEFLATEDYLVQNNIGAGDEVFSVGLFSAIAGARNEPIMRFGKIAAGRRSIQIPSDPGPQAGLMSVDAYLVESLSWGGASGAPVFLSFDPNRRLRAQMPSMTPLLGLVHGHYDIPVRVRRAEEHDQEPEIGDVRRVVGLNSGIAIVVPASAIRELLDHEDVVAWRRAVVPDP